MPRRRRLPPGVERRGDDTFRIRLSIPNGDGTYRRPSITVKGTIDDVWDVWAGLDRERAQGGTIDTTITVTEWVAKWLEVRKRTVGSPRTWIDDESRTRLFVDMFGSRPLRSITSDDIDLLYSVLLDRGLSGRTVAGYHRVLRKLFNDASSRIPNNPVTGATPPRVVETVKPVWTASQVAQFLRAVNNDRMFVWWHLALHTGMRREELVGLEWHDVGEDSITIRRRVVAHRGGVTVLDATKNRAPQRRIAVDAGTVDVLRRARVTHKERMLATVGWQPGLRLVTKDDGSPFHPDYVSERWRHLVTGSGLEPAIPLGRARHTWGTLALEAGIPQHVVAARLGHSTAMLLDRYAQPTVASDRDAAGVLARLMEEETG